MIQPESKPEEDCSGQNEAVTLPQFLPFFRIIGVKLPGEQSPGEHRASEKQRKPEEQMQQGDGNGCSSAGVVIWFKPVNQVEAVPGDQAVQDHKGKTKPGKTQGQFRQVQYGIKLSERREKHNGNCRKNLRKKRMQRSGGIQNLAAHCGKQPQESGTEQNFRSEQAGKPALRQAGCTVEKKNPEQPDGGSKDNAEKLRLSHWLFRFEQ